MVEQKIKKGVLNKTAYIITDKHARSTFFLVLSFIIILAINSFLPVIEGETKYTVGKIEVTYGEYKVMKAQNENYRLTWLTERDIEQYIDVYIKDHPELTEEEKVLVEPPSGFKVSVFTKFFFEYPFWYISTATSLGSVVILFYSLFNYLNIRNKDKYKEYIELEQEVKDMTKDVLDPTTFEPWIDNVFNYTRKITQHKHNVKYELEKLENKTDYKVKRKFKKYFEAVDRYQKDETDVTKIEMDNALDVLGTLSKQESAYLERKERLLYLLEPSYIENYVVGGRVKYFKHIHPMFVYNGENSIGRTIDGYSLIKTDKQRLTSDAGAKISLTLIVTVLFAVLFTVTAIASVEQSPFWIVVNIISKLAPLLIQVPMSIDYSNTFMDKQLITNMINRRSIGLLYLADMKKGVSLEPVELKPTPKIPEQSNNMDSFKNYSVGVVNLNTEITPSEEVEEVDTDAKTD